MKKTKAFYVELINRFEKLVKENDFLDEKIIITGKVLTPEEALGNPDRRDFPLLLGKERLMEADFRGSKGQAYTDMPGNFAGDLKSIIERYPENNFQRAVLVSSINAVCRYLGIADKTIHCKDNEPESCADEIAEFIKKEFGDVKIALVGCQPSMLEKLSAVFQIRNLDLDDEKVGTEKFGIEIEHGIERLDEVLGWSDIILATGSTIINSTIVKYLDLKPVYFYGTTISGAAALMGYNRLCFCAS